MVGFEASCTWEKGLMKRLIPGFWFSYPPGTWVRYAMSTIQNAGAAVTSSRRKGVKFHSSLIEWATSFEIRNNHHRKDGSCGPRIWYWVYDDTRSSVHEKKAGMHEGSPARGFGDDGRTTSTAEISWSIHECSATGSAVRFASLCALTCPQEIISKRWSTVFHTASIDWGSHRMVKYRPTQPQISKSVFA